MRNLLYLLLLLSLLSSCAASKKSVRIPDLHPPTTVAKPTPPATAVTVVTTPPERTAAGKVISAITGRDKARVTVTPDGAVSVGKNNKGSVAVSYGSGSASANKTEKKGSGAAGENASANTVAKNDAPVVTGDSSSAIQTGKNGITGNGNTTVKKPTLGQQLKDLPWKAIGIGVGALALWYFLAPAVAFLPSRQRLLGWLGYGKKDSDKTA